MALKKSLESTLFQFVVMQNTQTCYNYPTVPSPQVICLPYKYFFDAKVLQAQNITTPFDWKEVKVYEKLDGSLVILYHYLDKWHLASKRIPDASENVCFVSQDGKVPPKISLAEKFWAVWKCLNYQMPNDTTRCYMFELVSKTMRKLVYYPEDSIILHGTRCLQTLRELNPQQIAKEHGWQCVKQYPDLKTLEDIQAALNINPFKRVGFVVTDSSYNRIKCYSPQYVSAVASIGFVNGSPFNLTPDVFGSECLLELIRTNRTRQFLCYFPQWKSDIDSLFKNYQNLCQCIDNIHIQLNIQNKRQLADKVNQICPVYLKPVIFEMQKGGHRNASDVLTKIERKIFRGVLKQYNNTIK